MLIPYNTDAPIYHLPIATIGLIIVNTLVFLATTGAATTDEQFRAHYWLMLETGKINPVQWVTNNFMHADIMHLVGNMFFLWAFGLIVEGKLGWWRFLVLYLVIGTIYGALIQIPFFIIDTPTEVCLGASAVIFGLVAIAVLWAPKNDLGCFFFIMFVPRTVRVPIQVFGGIYLALQILPIVFFGLGLSSELLHMAGLIVGLPLGILLLKQGWVDCEGWDLFNVMKGKHTKLSSERREEGQAQRDPQRRAISAPSSTRASGKPAAEARNRSVSARGSVSSSTSRTRRPPGRRTRRDSATRETRAAGSRFRTPRAPWTPPRAPSGRLRRWSRGSSSQASRSATGDRSAKRAARSRRGPSPASLLASLALPGGPGLILPR